MKQIKFNSIILDLVNDINVDATRLQATVYKGDKSVDAIANTTKDCNIIQVIDGNKILGQYSGYTKPIAYSLNYLLSGEPIVSIELANVDITSQINDLKGQLESQADVVTGISDTVTRLDEAVDGLASIIGE